MLIKYIVTNLANIPYWVHRTLCAQMIAVKGAHGE